MVDSIKKLTSSVKKGHHLKKVGGGGGGGGFLLPWNIVENLSFWPSLLRRDVGSQRHDV